MPMVDYDKFFIDGGWLAPSSKSRFLVHSAATEELIGSVPQGFEADVDAAVAAARRAFDDPTGWATWSAERRADALQRFANALEARGSETARRVTVQNGMPIWLSRSIEAIFPAVLLRYYAQLMLERQEDRRTGMLGNQSIVRPEPIGVVAAIVPWNVPQGLTFVKVAPALASGCTVVLKPAPETVLDAFLMAEAAAEADLPPGVINIVPAEREVGAYLVAHPDVDKVSFTGSTAAGRAIGRICGQLLRPVTLELGGKSAAIVLDDADLTADPQAFFGATMINNGQTCWLGTRVLAPRSRYDEIVDAVGEMFSQLTIGDPLDETTQIGPLVSARQRDRVEGYIERGLSDGARLVAGGKRPPTEQRGWYVEPTVFADVDPSSTIAQEEIFGPVLTIIPYDGEEQAIKIANDTEYGLGGSVWSADPERALSVANRVRTGSIGINGYVNDPAIPFGGIKASGLGRELGPEGLGNFEVFKTIYLGVGSPVDVT